MTNNNKSYCNDCCSCECTCLPDEINIFEALKTQFGGCNFCSRDSYYVYIMMGNKRNLEVRMCNHCLKIVKGVMTHA